jgi:hypothetical protein
VRIARIVEVGAMLDYYELVDRLERLPVNEVTRSIAHCADEFLERIEDSDVAVRFVPDWADDSFKNAA